MVDHDLLHRELADLASGLDADSDLYEGLHRLTVTAAAALELDGAGVTLQIPGGDTSYVTATDPVTLKVERCQDEFQEGVCVDAIASSQIVAVSDLADEQRWPQLVPVIREAGFNAVAGIPIRFQGDSIGAVNLYTNARRTWTTADFNACRLIAELAAGYLVNNELLRSAQTLAEQLQEALDSRIIIEQAKGMVAGRAGMSPDAAFEIMRGYARGQRTKLRDVARGVVSGGIDVLSSAADKNAGAPTWTSARSKQ